MAKSFFSQEWQTMKVSGPVGAFRIGAPNGSEIFLLGDNHVGLAGKCTNANAKTADEFILEVAKLRGGVVHVIIESRTTSMDDIQRGQGMIDSVVRAFQDEEKVVLHAFDTRYLSVFSIFNDAYWAQRRHGDPTKLRGLLARYRTADAIASSIQKRSVKYIIEIPQSVDAWFKKQMQAAVRKYGDFGADRKKILAGINGVFDVAERMRFFIMECLSNVMDAYILGYMIIELTHRPGITFVVVAGMSHTYQYLDFLMDGRRKFVLLSECHLLSGWTPPPKGETLMKDVAPENFRCVDIDMTPASKRRSA
jgi:hypothetical protein